MKNENKILKDKILKYQVHPHFFYNTLDSIVSMIDIDHHSAKNILIDFSDLLRQINNLKEDHLVKLKIEKELIFKYCRLMETKKMNRLKFNFSISDDNDILIPSMILLPIIENSIKYGYSKERQKLIINIKIEKKTNHINLIVENNGKAIDQNLKYGKGINNTIERLKNLYAEFNFSIQNKAEKDGVITLIKIPALIE
nr:histidine kinase [uncultured Psychroserpens sp.]